MALHKVNPNTALPGTLRTARQRHLRHLEHCTWKGSLGNSPVRWWEVPPFESAKLLRKILEASR